MNILLASSEVVPFAKTGGLADVCGALPSKSSDLGIRLLFSCPPSARFIPLALNLCPLDVQLDIPLGTKIVSGRLLKGKLPGSNVTIYFVDQPDHYSRSGIYGEHGQDYDDNCERFTFFCRAVLEAVRVLDLQPDLIHANDWQTGLIPALLACEYHENPVYENIASLITIHNMAYQGSFWHWDMLLTGLDWKYFNWKQMEHYGRLNLLKTGIVFADAINTVSPTYALEIQTPEQGCGLEGALRNRADRLSGILNGIDTNDGTPRPTFTFLTTFGVRQPGN